MCNRLSPIYRAIRMDLTGTMMMMMTMMPPWRMLKAKTMIQTTREVAVVALVRMLPVET